MKIELIIIGSELLNGHLVERNSNFLAKKIWEKGMEISLITIVGDKEEYVENILKLSSSRSDIIIITGGLGPTADDITKKSLSKVFNKPLIVSEEALKNLIDENKFNISCKEQALIPEGAKLIKNKFGTAAGLIIEINNKFIIALPGVPSEMQQMSLDFVIPYISDLVKDKPKIKSKTIKFTDIFESEIDKKLSPLLQNDKQLHFSLLPDFFEVSLNLTVKAQNEIEANEKLEFYEMQCKKFFGKYIWGYDSDTMEKVVGELLGSKNLTLSVAESCTGGLVSHKITSVPGCSKYFKGSIVAYDNSIKEKILNILENHISSFGAVSLEVANEMSSGIRKLYMTDFGIGITGIAGPGGATSMKPLGLVYISLSTKNDVYCEKFIFDGTREQIQNKASFKALNMLRKNLLG
ncbi:MAG: competence/damage-inducible protein A [Candidatus Firestonebacteria bacterium]|nr:competence/damage-inducible protein A [Candidatus Firestonebacteria bacterium]